MLKRATELFPLWAILLSAAAYKAPAFWVSFKGMIVPLLGVVMFGMGITLTVADFRGVLRRPGVVGIGVLLQYLLMPLIAVCIGRLLRLPDELLVGMVLVGCAPGGTASNVICYLARADVALSITLTLTSTLISFIVTPALTWVYIGRMVTVPVGQMLVTILKIIIVPVVLGVGVNTLWGRRLEKFKHVFPLISVLAIVIIIAIIVGLNHEHIATAGGIVIVAVIAHNALGLASGYGLAKVFKFDDKRARTVAIEVGMQNSGLAVALAVKYFSALAALPGALFSIWHNLSGAFLARYWSRKETKNNP